VLPPLVPLATAGLVLLLVGLLVQSANRPGPGRAIGEAHRQGEPGQAPVSPAGSRPVQFVCLAVDASRVSVVGDFNDWDPGQAPLQRAGNRGVWSGLLWLPPGVYKYALVVDGRMQAADDARPASPPDEFGVASSVLIVERETI
jgi:1,4-alpha-glucan branching enzyme